MAFPSLLFPPSTPLFPRASFVLEYLREYAKCFDLMPHVQLNVTVKSVRWSGNAWKLFLTNGNSKETEFDHLIIANGHYRVPYIPPLPGLDVWIEEGRVTHSAWYRSPKPVGDVVLVVGAGPSGRDLADEMRLFCKTLIHAGAASAGKPTDEGNVKNRGHAIRFSERTVYFEDGSSESGIDHCFLATGYRMSFPFFEPIVSSMPAPIPPLPAHLHNSSHHVFPLARDLFPLQADFPSNAVAFMGLPIKVVPFPLFEAQMRAILRVFFDPAILDPTLEAIDIITRYDNLSREFGNDQLSVAHAWHRYRGNEQFDYRNALHSFAGYDGKKWKVRDWEIEYYDRKAVLRREWRALEASGEAEDWVRGVGEGGIEDWLDLMRRLVLRSSTSSASGAGEARL